MSRPVLAAALALALAACKDRERADDPALKLPVPPPAAGPTRALEELSFAKQAWLVDVGPARPVPDLVAHPPLFIGPVVIVAGSRVGYVALDRKTGAVAWRRPSSPSLGNPIEDDGWVVLVHDCEGEVAAAPGDVVLACVDRVHPTDVAAARASVIVAAEADLAGCAPSGAWVVSRGGLARGDCAWDVRGERAVRRATTPAPAPADDQLVGGWQRETRGTASYVHRGGPRVPGISVVAAAGGDAVVRLDSSLRADYALLDARAWWPLPAPADVRSTPVAIGRSDHDVVVFFDGSRVAGLTAP